MLAVDLGRLLQVSEGRGAQLAVMAESFDLEHPPVGRKTNPAQSG